MALFEINIDNPISVHGNIELNKGSLIFLEGKTGSGKTTLLYDLMEREEIRCKYGFLSQNYTLLDEFTIQQNFEVFSVASDIMLDYITKLQIDLSLDTNINQLSGGEKQRIALAIFLARKPNYLFLDEPVSHLDEENRALAMKVIQDYAHQGFSYVLVVNHSLGLEEYADDIYYLENHSISIKKQASIEKSKSTIATKFNLKKYLSYEISYCRSQYLFDFFVISVLVFMSCFGPYVKNQSFTKLTDRISTYVLIQSESIQKIEKADLLDQIQPFPSINVEYNGSLAVIYPAYGDLEFIECISEDGLFITFIQSQKRNIKIGDIVFLQDGTYYYVTGILSDQYIPPISINQYPVFYKKEVDVKTTTYIGKFKNLLNYNEDLEQLNLIDEKTTISFADPNSKILLDYNISLIQMINKVCKYGYIIIILLFMMILVKRKHQSKKNDYYLICQGLSRSSILCRNILYPTSIVLFNTIVYFIVFQIIQYYNIAILLVVFIINLYFVYSKEMYLQSIRGNEN